MININVNINCKTMDELEESIERLEEITTSGVTRKEVTICASVGENLEVYKGV